MTKTTTKKTASGIKLGSLVKDSITGFKGIAVGRTEFGYGCIHIRIQAQGLTQSGDPIDQQTFDDQRIEVLSPPTKTWREPADSPVKLGNLVRDNLSGAVGIVSAKSITIDGNVNFIIEQPGMTADGTPKPPFYANAAHVVVVEKRELKVSKDSAATSGGPVARAACLPGARLCI